MNQTRRTLIFVGAAVAMLLAAWLAWATLPSYEPEEELGRKLFPEIGDASAAARVTVTRYDEASRSASGLYLLRQGGEWNVPVPRTFPNPEPEPALLHPVDARGRMRRLFAALAEMEILAVVSDNRGDRELYGVEDPAAAETQREARTGVGIRVAVEDDAGQAIADLVVSRQTAAELGGNAGEVADGSSSTPLRYARRADQDRIYTVGFDAELLSTDLLDWIDRDLLAIQPARLKRVAISEHAILRQEEGLPKRFQRREMVLRHEARGDRSQWALEANRTFDLEGSPTDLPLSEGDRLNTHLLDHLGDALAGLRIAGVGGKPEGVLADLTVEGSFFQSPVTGAVLRILEEQGFSVLPVYGEPDAGPRGIAGFELCSSAGVVRCVRDDGVEVVMHFGSLNPGAEFVDRVTVDAPFSAVLGGPAAAAATLVSLAGQSGPAFQDMQTKTPGAGGLRRQRVLYAAAFPEDPSNQRQAAAAAELQSRLGPWYYVIPDETYRAIFLPQDRVVLVERDSPHDHVEGESHDHADPQPHREQRSGGSS